MAMWRRHTHSNLNRGHSKQSFSLSPGVQHKLMDGKDGPGCAGVYLFHWMVFFMEQLCLFADFSAESWRKKRLNAYGGSWGQWLFEELWKWKTALFQSETLPEDLVCSLSWLFVHITLDKRLIFSAQFHIDVCRAVILRWTYLEFRFWCQKNIKYQRLVAFVVTQEVFTTNLVSLLII